MKTQGRTCQVREPYTGVLGRWGSSAARWVATKQMPPDSCLTRFWPVHCDRRGLREEAGRWDPGDPLCQGREANLLSPAPARGPALLFSLSSSSKSAEEPTESLTFLLWGYKIRTENPSLWSKPIKLLTLDKNRLFWVKMKRGTWKDSGTQKNMEQKNEKSVASSNRGNVCQEEIHVCGEIGEDVGRATWSPWILLSDELRTQGYTLREENVRYDFF